MSKWPVRDLRSLCRDPVKDIVDGPFGSRLKREDYVTDGVPVLKIQNIKESGVLLKKMDYVTTKKFEELARHSFQRNDIVITKLGDPLGVAALVDELEFGLIVADLVRIRPNDDLVDRRYLTYAINAHATRAWLNERQKGTTRPRVSLRLVRDMPIPLPPLEEQKRIVEKLDETQSLISGATATLLRKEKLQTQLWIATLRAAYSAPGTKTVPFSQIASHSLGKMLDKSKNQGELRPYLRNANVRWSGFDLSDVKSMKILESERQRYAVEPGDLLICEGGYPGRCAIWTEAREMYFQKAVHRARFNEEDLASWVMYYLAYLDAAGGLEEHFSGTGIQHLTGEVLSRLTIPLPERAERQVRLAKIDQTRSLLDAMSEAAAASLNELSMLSEELTAQIFGGRP